MLDKIIRRCDSIDKESLCILAAQRVSVLKSISLILYLYKWFFLFIFLKVWHLRITVHFLADAGNLLDCACLAAMVALKHFRRPEVEVVGEEVIVVSIMWSCAGVSPNSYFCFLVAFPFVACTGAIGDPSHTLLPIFCVISGSWSAASPRSISIGIFFVWRCCLSSFECSKRTMCRTKSRRRAFTTPRFLTFSWYAVWLNHFVMLFLALIPFFKQLELKE